MMCGETLLIANDTWMAVCGTKLVSNAGACHKRTHVRIKLTATMPNVGKPRNRKASSQACGVLPGRPEKYPGQQGEQNALSLLVLPVTYNWLN